MRKKEIKGRKKENKNSTTKTYNNKEIKKRVTSKNNKVDNNIRLAIFFAVIAIH